MRRRDLIIGIAGSAAAWPIDTRAAAGCPGDRISRQRFTRPLRRSFACAPPRLARDRLCRRPECGDRYRWAEGRNDRLPGLAADLCAARLRYSHVTTPSALAPEGDDDNYSSRFLRRGDPVALGLVPSMNRPGGNFTGTTTLTLEVGSKWLQLLHEMVPTAHSFGLLPTQPVPISQMRKRGT